MPESAVNINKANVQECSIKGVNVRQLVHCIRVYETMCKPYITSEITLINENNFINVLQLKGGETVTFTILDSQGKTYSSTQYITGIPEQITSEGIRTEMVSITSASIAYHKDRANMVQSSHLLEPITSSISQIHSMYIGTPLQIILPSLGMIAKKEIGSYIVSNDKPFKAIRDLAARATYGAVPTGSTVYFENKYGHVLGPLQQIFANLDANIQADLIQKDTWGSSWRHMLGGMNADHAIIAAKLYKKEEDPSKAGGTVAQATGTAQYLFDQFARTHVIDKVASGIGGLFGVKNGGMQITQFFDKARNEASVDPSTKTNAEQAFQSAVKESPNYLIKCTIEAGMKITVGLGVSVKFAPPDPNMTSNPMDGTYLVADICHEVYTDNRVVNGTSTMRAVRQI
jgi:hypothetical protein